MFTAPSSNDLISPGTSRAQSDELSTFFSQIVQAYRSGTEKEKVSILHEVLNKIEEDENGEKMKEVGEMGLRMGFVSELCLTLGSECSPLLFVCLPSFLLISPLPSSFFLYLRSCCLCDWLGQNVASSVLTLVVGCVLHPKRKKMSDLLPSLLSLTHVCLSPPSSLLVHADPTLSVPATHAVGLVCDSSLSCGDVEGVLSGGVVEKVCSWVEGWTTVGKEVGKVLNLLRVVEKLCVGLKGALRSAQKQEQLRQQQKVKSEKEHGQTGQKEEESRDEWSLASRCQSALNLMGNTLFSLCSARESEEKESSAEMDVEVRAQAGALLAVHFPQMLSGGRKEVGVIGVDVGQEMRAMEERERRREEERNAEREEMTKKLKEVDSLKDELKKEMMSRESKWETETKTRDEEREREARRREEERRKEHELKMAELNEQAERHKRFIEEGEEREREASRQREEERRKEEERRREEERRKEEEMKRQLLVGAAAIEWFPPNFYSLNGSVFTRERTRLCYWPTLLSAEYGKVVVRFSFTFRKIYSNTSIGLVASALTATVKGGSDFTDFVGGAGWDMSSDCRFARHHNKYFRYRSACAASDDDQRVVLEADGRDGKRTLRLSQNGKTQPTFFSNIPVPFRFAIVLAMTGDAVSIESVEVVAKPKLSGIWTMIRMDEA
ncbi:hypothetical protein BLNAU_15377 [Blattamonas nauphoetae]|uniref:Uncharacterized protein n=1 Tax=Blattamonas nauphoetae TaxID=2049346 RepID=A0ABQ9XHD0_9EUKA|nr:hypothetical protein BLNAU_15377 [Blattamonas nauphoetae]